MSTPAVTEVSICSNALIKLGDDAITSLTDNTNRARHCNRLYGPTRDAVLRAHPWNFALVRASLVQLATEPEWGFAYEYQLPTGLLRVWKCDLDETNYKYVIEGRYLRTDAGEVNIVYIARVEDPTQFDALFTDTLTARLSRELAQAITGRAHLYDKYDAEYKDKLREARTVDGQEDYPQVIEANTLISCRS